MARNINAGRPHVPLFGRRIYGLRAFSRHTERQAARDTKSIAIERKSGVSIALLTERGDVDHWQRAYTSFVRGVERAAFGAVILDYDGTICDRANRNSGPETAVLEQLRRLLEAGVAIGIATGRGKSVRAALQGGLAEELWPRVFIGYYNGAECARLDDGACPDADAPPCAALAPVARRLEADPYVRQHASCSCRQWQITVTPTSPITVPSIWDIVQHAVAATAQAGVKVVRSSHSMDVLAPGVSKQFTYQCYSADRRASASYPLYRGSRSMAGKR